MAGKVRERRLTVVDGFLTSRDFRSSFTKDDKAAGKLRHKKPCSECPWRKTSPAGWLGGHPPEYYADAVDANEVPACHLKDFGPDDPKTAMCAGALATMANQCKAADNTPGGEAARQAVGRNNACFPHLREFYAYHAGKPYVHPVLRDTQETP